MCSWEENEKIIRVCNSLEVLLLTMHLNNCLHMFWCHTYSWKPHWKLNFRQDVYRHPVYRPYSEFANWKYQKGQLNMQLSLGDWFWQVIQLLSKIHWKLLDFTIFWKGSLIRRHLLLCAWEDLSLLKRLLKTWKLTAVWRTLAEKALVPGYAAFNSWEKPKVSHWVTPPGVWQGNYHQYW